MKAKGVISGYEDGSFGLGKRIVRAEVITILNRALGRTPSSEKVSQYIAKNGYPVADIEGHWAAEQIIEAISSHAISVLH